MSSTTQIPAATLALPIHVLQRYRAIELATAAVARLERMHSIGMSRTEAGRIASNAMWCGEQDAQADRWEALEARAADAFARAEELERVIRAAGFTPCGGELHTTIAASTSVDRLVIYSEEAMHLLELIERIPNGDHFAAMRSVREQVESELHALLRSGW